MIPVVVGSSPISHPNQIKQLPDSPPFCRNFWNVHVLVRYGEASCPARLGKFVHLDVSAFRFRSESFTANFAYCETGRVVRQVLIHFTALRRVELPREKLRTFFVPNTLLMPIQVLVWESPFPIWQQFID